jgi:hypothetical protein
MRFEESRTQGLRPTRRSGSLQRPLRAAGPNTFRRVGQRLLPKSLTARVSSRARESPPYRRPAIQKAGVDAPVRHKLGQRVPRAISSWFGLVVCAGRAEGPIQSCGGRGRWRTDEEQNHCPDNSTSGSAGPHGPQFAERLLGARPATSSPGIASRRTPPVCATGDRRSAPIEPPARPALASCRSCVPSAPARSWPSAANGSAGTSLR